MIALSSAIFILLIAALAELLHQRKISRIEAMIGASGQRVTTGARVLLWLAPVALGAMSWGCVTLLNLPPRSGGSAGVETSRRESSSLKRIVILLDVSPSMWLKDAQNGNQTRGQRARDVLTDILSRVSMEKARVSVIAFYTSTKPVVIDAVDPNLVQSILGRQSLFMAFKDGETDLIKGLRDTFEIMKDWRPGSATLLVVTDGDSVSRDALPAMPPAIARTVVIGVGDTTRGTFIDGHISRQEPGTLASVAQHISGRYFNADLVNPPTELIRDMSGSLPIHRNDPFDKRSAALLSVAIATLILLLRHPLLAVFGIRRDHRRQPIAYTSAESSTRKPEVLHA